MGDIFLQEHSAESLIEPADQRIARLHRAYLARHLARHLARTLAQDGALGGTVIELHDETMPAEAADLVLAVGLLGRSADPARLVDRLRGSVRPGGLLLLDLPGRPDFLPGLRQTMTIEELTALLGPHFAHLRVLGQTGMIGSALIAPGPAPLTVFTHLGHVQVEVTSGLARPDTVLVIASDAALDAIPSSLMVDAPLAALGRSEAAARQAVMERDALAQAHAALAAEHAQRQRTDAQWRHQLATLRVAAAAAAAREAAALQAHQEALQAPLAALARLAALERAALDRAEAAEAECARLRAAPPRGLRGRVNMPPRGLRGRVDMPLRGWLGGLGLSRLRPGSTARLAAIRASAAFDGAWYGAHYPDVAEAGLDPARHYLRNGAAEGRDPGPAFDASWYGAQHPDLAGSGLTAVEHYERHGRAQGWPTRPPAAAARPANPKVLFIAGEPGTPGAQYRCVRYAQAATAAGWSAGWRRIDQTGAADLIGVEIAILWRVDFSRHVEGIMHEIHRQGGVVVFDVDDLMIRPELARTSIIDGIRTTNAGIASTREFMAQVQLAMLRSDLCSTTTDELAAHMRAFQKASFVLPNGYDAATLAASRLAARRRALASPEPVVRIGYAAGTLTHQKDFAVALPGLLRVLTLRPAVRLVLFRARGGVDMVVVEEFEALAAWADRIEWRDTVALADLPAELARFDINIAPLELGNPFCEAKSELKMFEAALVGVPTVASPTGPFARSIEDGQTGLLAGDDEAWEQALLRLVDDADLRASLGRRAYLACLFRFGPERRAEIVDRFLRQVQGGMAGARAFAEEAGTPPPAMPPALQPAAVLYHADRLEAAAVTVMIPCYNYADYVIEALESVRAQTLDRLDLVVVDDCSTDPLATETILAWVDAHAGRFNRVRVLRHSHNAGLSAARNTGFEAAETPFVLPLDADNRLRPAACETLLAALQPSRAAYAYPSLQMVGAADSVFSNEHYRPARMIGGNYIDAMALVAKWAWAAAGGYTMPRHMGWEDFDLWCALAERGQHGMHVDAILAEYRVHEGSMVASLVEVDENKQRMVAEIERRHPWLRLSSRRPYQRV